jgi:protein-L-isoaspartate(D-aspartate) O-methyltransferase
MKPPADGQDRDWRVEAERMVRRIGPIPAAVAAALRKVPRHRFVPLAFQSEAYEDTPVPLGYGESTISAPHMVALQLEWAELARGSAVLEIGSGSGYLAALVAELVGPEGRVVGVEVDEPLAAHAQKTLAELGYASRVRLVAADGRAGFPPGSPYDRIIVSCATSEILPAWRDQLATPGVLVAPVGHRWGQVLRRLRTSAHGDRIEDGPDCLFVGLTERPATHK